MRALNDRGDGVRTEDGYLIHKCLSGDSDAFGLLVDKYKSGVYASVYSKLRNFHDAEDVTQEVFIRAYENLHKLRRWDSFASWLYRIASSLCRRWARTQSRRPDSEFIEDNAPEVWESYSMSSYREEVVFESIHEALDSLPDIHREVLMLHYFGGMTSFEIAKFVGASPAAVRKRLSKARSLLKAEMLPVIASAFGKRKLPAGFTLRISEIVKHIKLRPLRVPWGLPVATGAMLVVLTLRVFTNSLDPVSDYMDSAVLMAV